MKRDDDRPRAWRPPTRRVFVAMLGAAAAALAVRERADATPTATSDAIAHDARARDTRSGKTRWIGHC